MARKPLRFEMNPLLSGPSLEARTKMGSPYRELNIADIDVDPDQPRRTFSNESLAELAASIKEYGVLCPVLVRPTEGGSFRLVAGERRFRASKLLGRETIPAIIDSGENDTEILSKQLVENIQREDLNPLERAEAVGRLREQNKLSVREIAAKLGISKSLVQRSLDILALPPDLQAALVAGASESKVLLISHIADKATRSALLAKLEGLTRDQLEEEIGKITGAPKREKVSHRGTVQAERSLEHLSGEDRRIVEELQKSLGIKVQILRKGEDLKQGRLVLEFYSDDDLGEIYQRLVK